MTFPTCRLGTHQTRTARVTASATSSGRCDAAGPQTTFWAAGVWNWSVWLFKLLTEFTIQFERFKGKYHPNITECFFSVKIRKAQAKKTIPLQLLNSYCLLSYQFSYGFYKKRKNRKTDPQYSKVM